MIGQSLYYLNNKKYITNITNIGTVINELNSFYHIKTPRNIVVVNPDIENTQLAPGQFVLDAQALRADAEDYLSFVNFEDASTIDFFENDDKVIVAYTDEGEMLSVFVRYVAGLLHSSGFYTDTEHNVNTVACEFIEKVVESDTLLTIMKDSVVLNDAKNHCIAVLANAETPRYVVNYQNGKNFSYDLLFFLQEHYPVPEVGSLLIEKFTIHASEITKDVMQQFTAQRRDMAYLLSVIDWMNDNATDANGYATDKNAFITQVFVTPGTSGNWSIPFYALNELWDKVKNDSAFQAAHTSKTDPISGWEYNDQFNEINHLLPTVKKVLERTWSLDTLSTDLELLDTDVQFFSKRQNRIPYLIHKYTL